MRHFIAGGGILAIALACGYAIAADDLKSGPQVGDKFPGPFHPLNVTNADTPSKAGQKSCFV
jgi:hypothetical protein